MHRSFPFHDLGDDEFEELVRHICVEILGTGTITFAAGPDGGRDACFEGTAQKFPSTNSPFAGKFVIQAKHTSNPAGLCSSKEFSKLLDLEVPKLKRLIHDKEADYFLVFTNRRKPAGTTIRKEAELKKLGLKKANVFGTEQLRLWLTAHPQIWSRLGFDRFEQKFDIQPSDLTEVIKAFHDTLKAKTTKPEDLPHFPFEKKSKKNRINQLSSNYYKIILSDLLPFFKSIEDFLKNPRNEIYRDQYEDTADEIKRKIVANSSAFNTEVVPLPETAG